MKKIIIAAVSEDMAIGIKNKLPWHISEDLKRFKQITSGFPVIMGYRTFLSIGRPLPGRKNIIITKSGPYGNSGGITSVPSLKEAFYEAEKENKEKCFIIGGAKTYENALDYADEMYITLIHKQIPDADCFFPEIDRDVWEIEWVSPRFTDEKEQIEYSFCNYRRTLEKK